VGSFFLLFVIYTGYGVVTFSAPAGRFLVSVGAPIPPSVVSFPSVRYMPKISSIGFKQWISVTVLLIFSIFGIIIFKRGMARYKGIYVHYIMADFLSLRELEDRTK
jgi:hypothetical protein